MTQPVKQQAATELASHALTIARDIAAVRTDPEVGSLALAVEQLANAVLICCATPSSEAAA